MSIPGAVWPILASVKFDNISSRVLKSEYIDSDKVTISNPPINNTDGVNKTYVDSKSFKDSVRISTIGPVDFNTGFVSGQIVDNVTLATGDRILIQDQMNSSQNGIYVVNETGPPTRSDDAQTTIEASGIAVIVKEGDINADTFWVCNTTPSVNFGSNISFIQIVGGGSGSPASPDKAIQFNNGGAFGASSNLTWIGTTLTINGTTHTDTLELDDGSGNMITLVSPPLTADYTLTFPINDGDNNQILLTDGSGNTSWKSISSIYNRTEVNQAIYNVLTSDDLLAVLYTPTGTVTINLPKITTFKRYVIVDEGGNANVNNITVVPNVLDSIVGQTSFTINNNYNSLVIYNNGSTGWFII